MVESGGLENRYTREGIQGSNPCLSVEFLLTDQSITKHEVTDYFLAVTASFYRLLNRGYYGERAIKAR